MITKPSYDALIIGSGPNGLAAAITIARTGRSVLVLEAKEQIGGGARSAELTLPGFTHDVCSAIHPMGLASPFFRTLPLARYGIEWIQPEFALAHPLDHGQAALVARSLEVTAASLGVDATAYTKLMQPLLDNWESIINAFLGPLRPQTMLHPFKIAHFGLAALRSASGLTQTQFKGAAARAIFAGMSGHSMLPLNTLSSAAAGLMLGLLAHAVGWPIPRGGSHKIVDALAAYLRDLGGEIVTGMEVKSLDTLPPARVILCDITPRQLLRIAGSHLSGLYKRQLQHYRYGPGIFKLDLALDGPIPWSADACRRAGTVHVGGTFNEIARSERAIWRGEHPERPFVLLAQQSLFDETRAPQGKHAVWAYCHVPNGSDVDMSERIEAQIERFAPGFRDRILARHTTNAMDMERYNANYIGGDINGGIQDLAQMFTRPTISPTPYSTPDKSLYICSSSTPPGGGVHGMCGYFAAQAALRHLNQN
ncbi:FAD-dependent oxidoreductase [Ktedonobacter sp. SOSP1-52]|uniref:phytoene desaturase family protein n=1 Tax=Ktedonobacter sp. SOSP1-52 TaxID=2778366 RepID=UPI0019166302|nr:NAD(P)/FAD-dependent oxidoreductase [Ktedonobacter sp. SOSP1-52]GHO69591.1 FAD-dependent oxidoreductase [Ktedonobacter sp. SOSP1-52]